MFIQRSILLVYHYIKKALNKPFSFYKVLPYGWGHHIPLIYQIYILFIPCIYQSGCDIPVLYQAYSLYIILHGISFVYTSCIQYICIVNFKYIPCILMAESTSFANSAICANGGVGKYVLSAIKAARPGFDPPQCQLISICVSLGDL